MKLTTRKIVFPNGRPYVAIMLNGVLEGYVEAVDGGYLPLGMRKVRLTLQQAASALVQSDMARLRSRLAEAQRRLDGLGGKAVKRK